MRSDGTSPRGRGAIAGPSTPRGAGTSPGNGGASSPGSEGETSPALSVLVGSAAAGGLGGSVGLVGLGG